MYEICVWTRMQVRASICEEVQPIAKKKKKSLQPTLWFLKGGKKANHILVC